MNFKTRRSLIVLGIVIALAVIGVTILRSPKPEKRFLVVLKTLENPYYIAMKQGVDRAAAEFGKAKTVDVKAGSSEDNVEMQVGIIQDYLKTGRLAAVSLAPASSSGLVPIVAELNQRSIPVVVLDTKLDETELTKYGAHYDAFIGSDNKTGGSLAARHLGQLIGNKPLRVLLLEGVPTQETAISRAAGFNEVVAAEFPQWQVVRKTANWNRQEARAVMEALLSGEGVPAAVFACNDEMALGAVAALEAIGLPRSQWPPVVGFDATDDALRAVRDGRMEATVQQLPEQMGRAAIELSVALVRHERVAKDKAIPVQLIRR